MHRALITWTKEYYSSARVAFHMKRYLILRSWFNLINCWYCVLLASVGCLQNVNALSRHESSRRIISCPCCLRSIDLNSNTRFSYYYYIELSCCFIVACHMRHGKFSLTYYWYISYIFAVLFYVQKNVMCGFRDTSYRISCKSDMATRERVRADKFMWLQMWVSFEYMGAKLFTARSYSRKFMGWCYICAMVVVSQRRCLYDISQALDASHKYYWV